MNMAWANHLIEKLLKGETVSCRPHGNSMTPRIKSGQLCTLEPVNHLTLEKGDAVLCRVNGSQYIHLISAIKGSGEDRTYQISNNHGHVNGWVSKSQIFGKLIKVET